MAEIRVQEKRSSLAWLWLLLLALLIAAGVWWWMTTQNRSDDATMDRTPATSPTPPGATGPATVDPAGATPGPAVVEPGPGLTPPASGDTVGLDTMIPEAIALRD